jgi:HAE1 family hydrophobic/amphiphilic exporter-1
MRSLVAFAVARRVTILMVSMAVCAFGAVGYSRLAVDLLPDIHYPSLTVQTELLDAAPAEVENLVTRPVEEAVGVLRGLQSIHSVSRAGISEVTLEFDWGSNMDALSMDVRERLDRLVLPAEAEDPLVLRFDPALDPILRLALYGGDDLVQMRTMADKRLKQELETVKGVAAAQVKGGLEEEIQIDIDQGKLATLGIPMQSVIDRVRVSNINLPGGALRDRDSQYLVRTLNEYETVEDIGGLVVGTNRDVPVYLRDVAVVRRGHIERTEIARVRGKECVGLEIHKEGDANTVEVAKAVRAKIEELQKTLPPGHQFAILSDQSSFIVQSVDDVRSTALIGGLLAIGVLLLFLRDAWSAFIIATTIPLSVIATFMFMYRLDVSLNVMSMGGLALGIGNLVDNAIVVLEAVFRFRRRGMSRAASAIAGTTEVGPAVFASTLTTVAVFLPILFVEGVAGQLFRDQALTVSLSQVISLVVALTLCPMLAALGRRSGGDAAASEAARIAMERTAARFGSDDVELTLGRFSRVYDRLLRRTLRRPWVAVGGAAALLLVALAVVPQLSTELIPQLDQGQAFFEVTLPEGASIAATDRVVAEMERACAAEPLLERYDATVGSRLAAGGMALRTRDENLAQVNVTYRPDASVEARLASLEALRQRFSAIPDVHIKQGTPSYFTLKTPIEVVLYGENLTDLRDYAQQLAVRLGDVAGIVDLRSSLEAGNPELQIVFDRERLAALGLDMAQVSGVLRDRVQGTVPTRYKEEDRQIDIRVRNRELDRKTQQDVRALVVAERSGVPVQLASVASIELARGPAEIHRVEQQRAAVLTGNLAGRGLGAVVREIEGAMRELPPPSGLSAEVAGQNKEMQVSFRSLRFALVLAVFLVYLVMAATFESLVHPFIILFTIPLALVGVVLGLVVTGHPISVIVLMGVILLAGIVVNNAIVLVDAVNQGRRAGLDKRAALVRAGHIRLRPILMTTLTTVLGLLPMTLSFGEGAELRAPLAVTVAFGLTVSTALTLLVIPAVYLLVPSRIEVESQAPETATAAAPPPLPEPA